ncbi:ATP-dependent Clp protease ATP-binding subunit ClpC [compost metagenome]
MPFLNDVMEQTRRENSSKAAITAENCYTHDTLEAHLRSEASLDSRFRFDVSAVMAVLQSEILGQEEALKTIENILTVVRADILDPRRPLFTALFLGPTGVGKTEIVRALARALHGDADAFCRIDMNTLSQEHYAAALTGAPPGYAGAKEGKSLLDQSKLDGADGRPGIVLFDELEKASKEVSQSLLNVFDNGLLPLASGEKSFNFRNTLIFMTSNLAANDIRKDRLGPLASIRRFLGTDRRDHLVKMVRQKLVNRFSPEFVNRIDNTIVFNSIEQDVSEQLVSLEIFRLNRRLAKHRCVLELDSNVIRKLAVDGYDDEFGARALKRLIRQHVEVPLASYLLGCEKVSGMEVGILSVYGHLERGKINFSIRT